MYTKVFNCRRNVFVITKEENTTKNKNKYKHTPLAQLLGNS